MEEFVASEPKRLHNDSLQLLTQLIVADTFAGVTKLIKDSIARLQGSDHSQGAFAPSHTGTDRCYPCAADQGGHRGRHAGHATGARAAQSSQMCTCSKG